MSELIVRMEMPKKCIDCCVRSNCELYMNELRKPFEQRDFETIKPLGSKGCLIRGALPEQHGDLIDRDVALNDIERFICNGCSHGSEDDCLWCTAYAAKGVLTEVDPIIADAERSET